MPTGQCVQWLILQPSAVLASIFSCSILDQWRSQEPCSSAGGERCADLQGQWHAQALHHLGYEWHPHREWVHPIPLTETVLRKDISRSRFFIFHIRLSISIFFISLFETRLLFSKYTFVNTAWYWVFTMPFLSHSEKQEDVFLQCNTKWAKLLYSISISIFFVRIVQHFKKFSVIQSLPSLHTKPRNSLTHNPL